MIDYKNGKIYRLVCNTTSDQYIGSTTQSLSQRLGSHQAQYKQFLKGKITKQISSYSILSNNNFEIILLEEFACENKNQLERRERYFIETMKCVNKYKPSRTKEELQKYMQTYQQVHKEELQKYHQMYQQVHKEKIQKYQQTYNEEHKEELQKNTQTYRQVHKEEIQKYRQEHKEEMKKYRQEHKEEINKKRREYRQEHREELNKKRQAYQQKLKENKIKEIEE